MAFLICGVLLQVSIIDLVFQTGGGGCVVLFVMISIKNKEGGGKGSNQSPVPPCLLLFLNYTVTIFVMLVS